MSCDLPGLALYKARGPRARLFSPYDLPRFIQHDEVSRAIIQFPLGLSLPRQIPLEALPHGSRVLLVTVFGATFLVTTHKRLKSF